MKGLHDKGLYNERPILRKNYMIKELYDKKII